MGRPKKGTEGLPDGWQEAILDLYKEGGSDVEVKALICSWVDSISNDLWVRWMKEETIFSETIKKGKMLSEAWWQKAGRENLKDKEFNYTGWYMNMKNRFGWADRQEVKHNGTMVNITVDNEAKKGLDDILGGTNQETE